MTNLNPLIPELENAFKSGSSEKRIAALRKVTDLFLEEGEALSEQQIAVFDDVLVHLIRHVEARTLAQLSDTIAPLGHAPIQVIQQLSNHDDLAVASPVLRHSPRLSDADLIRVVRSRGTGHMLAISSRSRVSEAVTDALVECGDAQVHQTLARNSGARFSEAGYAALVNKSERDTTLCEALGLRLDIPINLLRQLLARATESVRQRLMASSSAAHRAHIEQALDKAAKDVDRRVAVRDFTRADGIVQQLNRTGRLTESTLVTFARERQYEEMTATLALFCGAKSDFIERVMQNKKLDGLLMACKAAKLSWPTVQLILTNCFSHRDLKGPGLEAARANYLQLSFETAQRTVRFMAVREVAGRVHTESKA